MLVSNSEIRYSSLANQKLNRPGKLVPFGNNSDDSKNNAKFKNYEERVPDSIYNFFDELPKYELHSHFNGATPLNISKLFLNNEGRFIGISQEELEDKYNDIRKRSESLEDWLKKTYELKVQNITTMDIMNAAYAIAMAEAKHNCRYLEVRIDPYSNSFVGAPEDVIRAVEVGLRNAREDIKDMGKDLKTSIILLAERHGSNPAETSLKTARLATKMRSQRVLFEKMYKELKASEAKGNVFERSGVLTQSYIQLMNLRKVSNLVNRTVEDIYASKEIDRKSIETSLDKIVHLLNTNDVRKTQTEISPDNIDRVYNAITTRKTKSISTIDLVPVVYSTVLDQVRKGQKHIILSINPLDDLYKGQPEDILRAVQVGLRNATEDLEKTHGKIESSIVIKADAKEISEEQAQDFAKLVVKMKSQRILFENMYAEMKEVVKKDRLFDKSIVLDQLVSDLSILQDIKEDVTTILSKNGSTKNEVLAVIDKILEKNLPQIDTPTANIKTDRVLKAIRYLVDSKDISDTNRNEVLNKFNLAFNKPESYLQDKVLLARKIFDNLKHNSNLLLEDKANGTKNADRYLRMGSGVIPNVIALHFENKSSNSPLNFALKYIDQYNDRKPDAHEKVLVLKGLTKRVINLGDSIRNPQKELGTTLETVEKAASGDGLDSFDESSIHTVYSKSHIIQDVNNIRKLIVNADNPDTYVKLQATRDLNDVANKVNTQFDMHENKFLLAKRIFDKLNHYSHLRVEDKKNGTKNASRFARMGVDITPNVIGFDLAGNENKFPTNIHTPALHHIQYYNDTKTNPEDELKVTLHSGEVKNSADKPGWENIKDGIKLGAHRIGHGIDLRNAPKELVNEVKRRNILMETCPKVNFQTKAVEGYRNHPILDFLDQDIPANINTDNPVTAGTNLTNEFVKVFKRFNFNITPEERENGIKERFTLGHVKKIIHNAIWGAFALSPQEKAAEEEYAMHKIDELVTKYSDKVILNDNEPIMLKVQKGVVAFTGRIKLALAQQLKQNKAA
ncbi:MAG: hypothetical protein AB1782_04930 [Cyanobacteriota bacterium]